MCVHTEFIYRQKIAIDDWWKNIYLVDYTWLDEQLDTRVLFVWLFLGQYRMMELTLEEDSHPKSDIVELILQIL